MEYGKTSTLHTELRRTSGRNPEPSAAVLDSQSIKTTEILGVHGYDVGKKVNGRKRHIIVDTMDVELREKATEFIVDCTDARTVVQNLMQTETEQEIS